MFGERVEKQIRESIEKQTSIRVTNEDVHKMHTVPNLNKNSKVLILCLHVENQTILVPVRVSATGQELLIGEIKTVTW